MEMYQFAIAHDWPVLTPIAVCSILALAVTIERIWYFRRNRRGVDEFLAGFQEQIMRGIPYAKKWADGHTGVVPQVASEGLRILAERPERFETLYEVASSLASRPLYRGLTILGTIATISPYLGLFGTVVRILLTFGELAQSSGGNSATIMFGIGSALIATAFGLAVAILAVSMNNYLHTVADEFARDFELVKLMCLSANGQRRDGAGRQPATWSEAERRV